MVPTEEEYYDLYGFPCYEFNSSLEPGYDDWHCTHCAKFLTLDCEHLELFIGEEDEVL
ncbi:MAG: hypothetical protein ACE5HJ_02045 [Thermoplasmata archaeon]